jgi:hypothetical protein
MLAGFDRAFAKSAALAPAFEAQPKKLTPAKKGKTEQAENLMNAPRVIVRRM